MVTHVTPVSIVDICDRDLQGSAWDHLNAEMDSLMAAGRLSLLLGSGISQYAPCSVPYAGEITRFLTARLMAALPADFHVPDSGAALNVPFEVLMARLAELDVNAAREAALILTKTNSPTPLHRQIAALLQRCAERGTRLPVVTTNYDIGISCAVEELRQIGRWPSALPDPQITVRHEDLPTTREQPEIFHIHGVTTDPSTLVLDYKEEFGLPSWKTRHLRTLLEDTSLLVIGFSGWDLDISKALAGCRLSSIIWLRRDMSECEEWSPDAARLLNVCPVTAVNTEGDLRYALTRLARVGHEPLERDDRQVAQRFAQLDATYGSQREPWFGIWARWAMLRAGYAQLVHSIPPEEAALLTPEQLLELEAFGHYYSGRHASGARLQRQAAHIVRKRDLGRYLYFRNNEIEFLNRGAYTLKALRSAAATLIKLPPQALSRSRWTSAASAELRNLLTSVVLVWPLLSIFRNSILWRRLGPLVVSLLARIVRGADLDKYQSLLLASPSNTRLAEAEAHYRWLGQGARLINLYRFNALQNLRQGYRSKNCGLVHEAHRLAELALLEAGRIDDPCRMAKCQLVWTETVRQLQALCSGACGRAEKSAGHHITIQSVSDIADAAWWQIVGTEVWKPYYLLARSVYYNADRTADRWSGRLRILALALLETS